MPSPRTLVVTAALLLVAAPAAPATASPARGGDHERPRSGRYVDVQLLGINDFHGALEADQTFRTGPQPGDVAAVGGIEYLSGLVKAKERENANTTVVSAGDLIGASPLLSALFHDEPTIEAMNLLGLDYDAVGNHEFDEGAAELLRMQHGGCHPVDGCQDGDGFEGADFRFLAANVVRADSGETIFPAYAIERYRGARVGFIGLTLAGTPEIVTPSGVAGLRFLDEAQAINAAAARLRRRGVRTIVVLIHQGGRRSGFGFDDCGGVGDPIRSIVQRTTRDVDIFLSGHTHQAYNCVIDGRPVTSASSNGRLITDVELTIDRRTGEPASIHAENQLVFRRPGVDPVDPRETALLDRYRPLAAPIANRVIGSLAADVTRATTPAGESAAGDLIADAQLEATRATGGAVIAFMNPGGIRGDFVYAPSGSEAPGEVTYGEAFTIQPFGNTLVTKTLTGAQIERLLEQQFQTGRTLQVSSGFGYTWDASRPAGDSVDPASIRLGGVVLDPATGYRVTVNSFLADGGDGFTVLREGTDTVGGPLDLDALSAYFAAHSPVAPPLRDRIVRSS